MCWMCDRDVKSPLVHSFLSDADSVSRLHFSPAQDKNLDAMMLTGHDLVPPQLPTVIITTDAQPGDTSTTATITVGGPHIVSSLETIGDQDYFAVHLEAGQAYEIGQYAKAGGPMRAAARSLSRFMIRRQPDRSATAARTPCSTISIPASTS